MSEYMKIYKSNITKSDGAEVDNWVEISEGTDKAPVVIDLMTGEEVVRSRVVKFGLKCTKRFCTDGAITISAKKRLGNKFIDVIEDKWTFALNTEEMTSENAEEIGDWNREITIEDIVNERDYTVFWGKFDGGEGQIEETDNSFSINVSGIITYAY